MNVGNNGSSESNNAKELRNNLGKKQFPFARVPRFRKFLAMTARSKNRALAAEAWIRRGLSAICVYFIIDTHVSMKTNAVESREWRGEYGDRITVLEVKFEERDAEFTRLAHLLERRIAQAESVARHADSAAER